MSWIRETIAGRFIAMLIAMQLLGAQFCLPCPSSTVPEDTIAFAATDYAGEPCGSTAKDCHEALCHPALASAVLPVSIESSSQRPPSYQASFPQFASGPGSRPPLSVSA